jgi:hypothetical protein
MLISVRLPFTATDIPKNKPGDKQRMLLARRRLLVSGWQCAAERPEFAGAGSASTSYC